jgi:hypothetical protein
MNNPLTGIRSALTKITDSIMRLDTFNIFKEKVNGRLYPQYYQVVKSPMWLNKIKSNVREKRYRSRSEFLRDLNLLVTNSALFNGQVHEITAAARRIYDNAKRLCDVEAESFEIWEQKLSADEKREFQKKNSFKSGGSFGGKGYVQGFDRNKKEEEEGKKEKKKPAAISTTTTTATTTTFSEPPTPTFSEPPTPLFSEPRTPASPSAMLMDLDNFDSDDEEEEEKEEILLRGDMGFLGGEK